MTFDLKGVVKMAVSCATIPLENLYFVTDSKIIRLLQWYIGYDGPTFQKKAEEELCIETLKKQFDIFCKDIKKVLYNNFKVKKKINQYDDKDLVNEIISYVGGDDDNFYRNSLIAILKVLNYVENEIQNYNNDMLKDRNVFGGFASFLHLLLCHIEEFTIKVATVKEKKNYSRTYSRKKLSAKEVFDLAKRISRSQTYTNEMTHIYESIFFIRQAIELKVLESLCVKAVINKKHSRPIKISPDVFIGILDNNAVKLRDIDGVDSVLDVKFIKKVHYWTNAFIHSGYGYWFWEVELVRIALQDFMYYNIEFDLDYLKLIPEKILQCIKEEERLDAEVIMSKQYYHLINDWEVKKL